MAEIMAFSFQRGSQSAHEFIHYQPKIKSCIGSRGKYGILTAYLETKATSMMNDWYKMTPG